MIGVEQAYARVDRQTVMLVADAVANMGVPVTLGNVSEVAARIMPQVVEMRRMLWADEVRAIRVQHPGLELADVRFYPQPALEKIIRRAAGLEPESYLVDVTYMDPLTAERATRKVLPYMAADEDAAVAAFQARLAADLAVHVKQASRDTIADVAHINKVRYARMLTGKESCAFCVMLASRGAVYSKSTATRTGKGDAYHTHCDCIAVVVPNVDSWEGKEQADALYREWDASGGTLSKFRKHIKEKELTFDNGVPLAA